MVVTEILKGTKGTKYFSLVILLFGSTAVGNTNYANRRRSIVEQGEVRSGK